MIKAKNVLYNLFFPKLKCIIAMLGLANEKKYEKNYLCFNFFVLSYYLYIELGQRPRHI